MLVTFIIVAYNAEKVIESCLTSLKNQNYPHEEIEVILVDSSSTDNTKQLMMQFQEKAKEEYNRVLVLDNPKRTLPCGWNVALKEAKGEVVVRVDAHTIYPEDFIQKNVKEIEKGEDIVGGQCISITKNDTKWEKVLLSAEESIFGCGIADFRRKKERKYVSTLAFAMYRKKVFDEVGPYNENLARTEDNEMHYRMKKVGYRFLLSPDIVTYRYARNTLKDMIKQKYNNGKWIGITIRYCPRCFSIYHFVPLFFILAILGSIVFTIFNIPYFLIALLGAYGIFNLCNIVILVYNKQFTISHLFIPIVLFLLHVSYGIGTLVGIFKGMLRKS
ncbi:MAG: glycosyltransferase family 2 protein [Clostridia bacterium]|nr:glycosyltransferase family 2 protein [Clostridia bacterium]